MSILPGPNASWFEPLLPAFSGLAIYVGVNIGFVAPEIVTPRLVEKIYQPACLSGVRQHANTIAMHKTDRMKRIRELNERKMRFIREKSAEITNKILPGFGAMAKRDPFVGGFVDTYLGAIKDAQELNVLSNQASRDESPLSVHSTAEAWCRCTISKALDDRIGPGLYVASWRFWKPEIVSQLENQSERLLISDACGVPPIK